MSAGLPLPFALEGLERRDVTPAHEALREAFVNALIHADYRAEGGIVFERYPDRFLLENPGTLLVSLEQYHRGETSECRNKALQKMFLLIGGGEHAGSGVARIKQGWASRHWRSPSLELTRQPDRVRLSLPMVSLIPEEALAGMRQIFGKDIDVLGAEELQAVATAYFEKRVTNARLQELLDTHPADISRMLAGLCERGYLLSDNKRRWTSYRLNVGSNPGEIDDSSGHKGEDSIHKGEDSVHKGEDSVHKGEDSVHKSGDSAQETSVAKELAAIARAVPQGRRASPLAVRNAIERLCRDHFLEAEEIGKYLKRNYVGIRQRYLKPMVEEGILELRFPEAPNRPDQAYRSTGHGV
ncbi:MAG: ATP-binding protein [Spirochaetota bacterium]